ncbi:MAG TPA: c-type cytochrome domain-containing protein [Verrucomicrobiae bacterium]|nr:c-type cytochrome domain-containing protein [Verrucomicrobiae bacterium]
MLFVSLLLTSLSSPAADFSDIEPLLQQHCVECHGVKDPEASLVLESYEGLMKGGENGAAIVPGKSAESMLVKAIEGTWGKKGKNEFMPPGKKEKLRPEQIALFKAWIDAGAPAPKGVAAVTELNVPKIAPTTTPRRAINALAYSSKNGLLAIARYGEVELFDPVERVTKRVLTGARGAVNAVAFSADGAFVFGASGQPGLSGEARQWKTDDGSLARVFEGHKDALYSLAVSPDGMTLATGSYDYQIKLWNVADGALRKTIAASQGAIFDLAFRPDGKVLASASADRTAKLYNAASGDRIETLSQALKEVFAIAFSPDGKRLATGGGDNRIRIYEISAEAKEGSNTLQLSQFAHEGAILRLAFSADGKTLLSAADDKTVKLFNTADFTERLAFERQPDWPSAAAFLGSDQSVAIGRQDGTLEIYSTKDGKVVRPPAPELARIEPRGIQRGIATKVKLTGKHFSGLTGVKSPSDKIKGIIEPGAAREEAWITLTAEPDTMRGAFEISVVSTNGESGRVKVYVDDLPQWSRNENGLVPAVATEGVTATTNFTLPAGPLSVWGTLLKPGETNDYAFTAPAGQTLIFDLDGRSLGAKGNFSLILADEHGKPLASNDTFSGADDPFLARTFSTGGTFHLRVHDAMLTGSADHFYRLSVGALPFIAGVFPLSVPANTETNVQLIGYNLPNGGKVTVKSGSSGEVGLTGDATTWRARRETKLLVADYAAPLEQEPNDSPDKANKIPVPASVNGQINGNGGDVDYFTFDAKEGQNFIIETTAVQRGAPTDTKVEVLWPNGKPVERLQLRALRDSAFTFRNKDANDFGIRFENWEEMELNDYIYANGEVMKMNRLPQGPDSDSLLYSSNNRRRPYFDTTAIGHPLDEPCYVVEAQPVGTKVAPNGLPVFHLNYENDDDSLRMLGSDSRVHFTAPKDGAYLVRVTDARGFHGDRFVYRLVVREAAPDFKVVLDGAGPTVAPGSGQGFSVRVERMDGFDGDVRVEFLRLPKGWTASNPLVIQAGHESAQGTLHVDAMAPPASDADWDNVGVIASAKVEGRPVIMTVNNFGRPKVAKEKAKMLVKFEPIAGQPGAADSDAIYIGPGQTVRAKVSVEKNGFDDAVRFEVQNLPHGVIVDNIGLNGITFLKGESEREIYLTASKWVQDMDRPIYCVETAVGSQTSLPVMLKIRRADKMAAATAAGK